MAEALGANIPEPTVSEKWHPKDAPTAVQVVEMLQMLRCNALRSPAKRLAIMLSAWDKVEEEGLDSEAFLARELPLLDQYLGRATAAANSASTGSAHGAATTNPICAKAKR